MTGNALVNSSSLTVKGAGGTTFSSTFAAGDYVVISDGTASNTLIRVVTATINSTAMVVDEFPSFTNSAGVSYYKTAVGRLYFFDKISDKFVISDSNANSTCFGTDIYITHLRKARPKIINGIGIVSVRRADYGNHSVTPQLWTYYRLLGLFCQGAKILNLFKLNRSLESVDHCILMGNNKDISSFVSHFPHDFDKLIRSCAVHCSVKYLVKH